MTNMNNILGNYICDNFEGGTAWFEVRPASVDDYTGTSRHIATLVRIDFVMPHTADCAIESDLSGKTDIDAPFKKRVCKAVKYDQCESMLSDIASAMQVEIVEFNCLELINYRINEGV